MNIEEKDVSEIKDFLKRQFEDGARWAAYQKDKMHIARNDLHVFTSCNDADDFCGKASSMHYQYQYTPLRKIFDALADNKPETNAYGEIYEAWNKQPIEFLFGDANIGVIEKLNRGEWVPVNYKKDFIPRGEIGSYHVVELSGRGSDVQSHKIIKLSLDAEKAKQFYHEEINTAVKDPLRQGHQLLLIGEFKNQSLQMERDATPINNTGLLLSMASAIEDEFGLARHRDYKTLYAIDEPAFLFQSAFAKYNHQSRELDFYDDKLEQIPDLMKAWSLVKVDSYDTAQVVVLKAPNIDEEQTLVQTVNAPSKNINGEEKMCSADKQQKHSEEEKRHSHKLRTKL